MKSNNLKLMCLIFIFGILLLLSPNLNAQSKVKQKNMIDSTALENFLIVKHNYIKIPIKRMASGHLYVNVLLNGVKGEFILDTGAGATVVETNRKDKFKLQTDDSENSGAGAGGTQTLQKAINNTLKLGSLTKSKFDLYIMNLDHVNNALSSMGLKEIDGVIGADILTENKAIIDYSNLILYLQK